MSQRLKDKVILVTGSTTGIGEGMVRVFAREGAKVMIHGRRKEAAQKLAAELGEAAFFRIGALDDAQVPARLIAETVDHFGRIDGLVNNAAAIVRENIEKTDSELFDRTVAVDLKAPFLLIQAALPHFRQQRYRAGAEYRVHQCLLWRAKSIYLLHLQKGPDDHDAQPRGRSWNRRHPREPVKRRLEL